MVAIAVPHVRHAVHTPTPERVARAQMTAFMRFCEERTSLALEGGRALHAFSVRDHRRFWRLFLEWSELEVVGSREPVVTSDDCETATFFPSLSLSYAASLLRVFGPADDAKPAVIACDERGARVVVTRAALRERVLAAATELRALGVREGDRVVAVASSTAETVVAALACVALGASWSSVSPDLGVAAILDRFAQLEPSLLFAHASYLQSGARFPIADRLRAIIARLPSLRGVVALDSDGAELDGAVTLEAIVAAGRARPERLTLDGLPRLPFNHPLFIVFSSGTTGRPKCIVHGAGGTLLEHLKEHRLHGDFGPGDTLFFHTTCAWMMWNWQLSALACGTTIVLYRGSAVFPRADSLWELVARERVTVFGTSPAFLQHSRDEGLEPAARLDLSALRAIQSTGSILPDTLFGWAARAVGPLPLQSISGGTDILGCFLLGDPRRPVYAGELQAVSLGLDVQAHGAGPGRAVGELVCKNPFPSRPLGLYGDEGGRRFHEAYFSRGLGGWEHGDWVELTAEGGGRMHGRSDGVMNVRGIRIGPAEIYAALADVEAIRAALAVEQRAPQEPGGSRFVLLVVLAPGVKLDAALAVRIRRTLVDRCSPAHAPSVVAAVDDLPTTFSGKRSERAATDALDGRPVANEGALRNPECLPAIRAAVARAAVDDEPAAGGAEGLTAMLASAFRAVLRLREVGPDDDFFELGGDSLGALHLTERIERATGVRLPLAALLHAPTIAELAQLLRGSERPSWSCLVPLRKTGTARPFFCVHAVGGNVLNYRLLARHLGADRPVFGLQARGLDGEQPPHATLEEMAAAYVEEIRRVQPEGPYLLGGSSSGGVIAWEMARQLHARGELVGALILFDTYLDDARGRLAKERSALHDRGLRIDHHLGNLLLRTPREGLRYLADRVRARWNGVAAPMDATMKEATPLARRVYASTRRVVDLYVPKPYEGSATLLAVRDAPYRTSFDDRLVWVDLAKGGLTVRFIPGNHDNMLEEPQVAELARVIADSIDEARITCRSSPPGSGQAARSGGRRAVGVLD